MSSENSASLVNSIHPGPPLTAVKASNSSVPTVLYPSMELIHAQGDRLNVTVNNLLNNATQVLGTSIVHTFPEQSAFTHIDASIGMVYFKRGPISWMVSLGLINAQLPLGILSHMSSMQIHLGYGGIIHILVGGVPFTKRGIPDYELRCTIL